MLFVPSSLWGWSVFALEVAIVLVAAAMVLTALVLVFASLAPWRVKIFDPARRRLGDSLSHTDDMFLRCQHCRHHPPLALLDEVSLRDEGYSVERYGCAHCPHEVRREKHMTAEGPIETHTWRESFPLSGIPELDRPVTLGDGRAGVPVRQTVSGLIFSIAGTNEEIAWSTGAGSTLFGDHIPDWVTESQT